MKLAGYRLRQRDGISCGPTVAVVAAALLDDGYRSQLQAGSGWFGTEQDMVHRLVNRVWPRRLGMTPPGVAAAIADRCGVRCRWRIARAVLPGRVDVLTDVLDTLRAGAPVPMLIGHLIPRHWVLIVAVTGERLRCFDPASGALVRSPFRLSGKRNWRGSDSADRSLSCYRSDQGRVAPPCASNYSLDTCPACLRRSSAD
ncbi:hypothetical protein [Mycolicibacterium sp. PDY-3]|uniref:hypothetical protein n=1 Tax=Mycolicibacterium sp. PDY-3 TaxID=3376069 RepID=UPI003796777B